MPRIIDQKTNLPIDFTCNNERCRTDIERGHPHGLGQALGSVFDSALVDHGDASLWLEHAIWTDSKTQIENETYWLMWYSANGVPTIAVGAAIDNADLREMARRFVTVP